MMVNKKVRRHSGRIPAKAKTPEGLLYDAEYYDEWNNFRDGFRNWYNDKTQFKRKDKDKVCMNVYCGITQNNWDGWYEVSCTTCMNLKLAKETKIRYARKASERNE